MEGPPASTTIASSRHIAPAPLGQFAALPRESGFAEN
jgi:hypothetical protein